MFSQIFDALDSDQDGYLSARCIDVDNLPNETNQLLEEIYKELVGHIKVDREEFLEACNRLYKLLQPHQRKVLLSTFKLPRNLEEKEFPFHPDTSPGRQTHGSFSPFRKYDEQQKMPSQSQNEEIRKQKEFE